MEKIIILIPRKLINIRDNFILDSINSVKNYPILICPDINKLGPGNAIVNTISNINLPEYIGILDDDDYVVDGAIEKFIELLDKYPSSPFCCADFFAIKDGVEIEYKFKIPFPTTETLKKSCGIRGLKIYRTSFVKAVGGFDPTLPINYDYDIMKRLSIKFGCPLYIDEKLTYYRIHENQLTNHSNNMTPYGNWIRSRPDN